jgi:hypothetical protein
MSFPPFDKSYSQEEWLILERAHRRACMLLDRDPRFHPLAERVAFTIMVFFERGEHDFGRLATMAVKREHGLLRAERRSGARTPAMLWSASNRPKYLH